MPVMIRVTVRNKDMGDIHPFRLWNKSGKSEPVKNKATGSMASFLPPDSTKKAL
jgi:hypothetical protein